MSRRRLPSLSALRAFEAAARHESAKQAAEELSVTATAISHLEETLGVALFLRKPRQLELTAAGRELQQVLESAFDTIDRDSREQNKDAFQAVRNQGLELVKPSDEQRAEWKRYADKATNELVEEGELSRDMLDRLHRILEAHRDTAE